AAIFPPPEHAGSLELPAHRATKAATSVTSEPLTRFAGMTVVPVGLTCPFGVSIPWSGRRIWSATICWIELDLKPWATSAENALSRFGPIVAVEPAAASV